MEIDLHQITDRYKKYAVILTYENNNLILVRHKERSTWEIPGGKIEFGESILSAAKRELFEETGATNFNIRHLFDYSVDRGDEINYGGLFIANVYKRNKQLTHEIAQVKSFSTLPPLECLTYGKIQGSLFNLVISSCKDTISEFLKKGKD